LEEGGTIRNCQLAYATFGTLNAAKDNAILVPTWYSGTNKIIEQVFVGSGHALDPDKYFIIIVNQIGGGLSTSPHNTPPPAGMANFPRVRIGDDVRAQHKLITEKFDLNNLALVVGGSMGAQQTYEWAVCYPDISVQRRSPAPQETRSMISCSPRPWSMRSPPTPASTRVSIRAPRTYAKVYCVTPKSGQ
jgi:homoserine O-acetyltransferase